MAAYSRVDDYQLQLMHEVRSFSYFLNIFLQYFIFLGADVEERM